MNKNLLLVEMSNCKEHFKKHKPETVVHTTEAAAW